MEKSSPVLQICLLGTPQIGVAGSALTLSHLKAEALLFYLAASGQARSRDQLATLLWSEAGPNEAHHSLRTSLYRLRQALRASGVEGLLAVQGDQLGLRPGGYTCDVSEFRGWLAEGGEPALARAVAAYRGPFLEGFSLGDAPEFDEWARAEDTRLRQACFEALERLSAGAEAREAWAAAAGYALQMVQIDPLAETAQQRLMRAYLRQGEASQALRQYHHFETQLRQELGLSPAAETRALLDGALRQQRSPAAPFPSSAASPARQPYSLPFSGREGQLEELSALSREVPSGRGTTVLLEGEGGIGKSRLLDELATRLSRATPPWRILQGACTPYDDLLANGPFLEALQDFVPPGAPTARLIEPETGAADARGQFSWQALQTIRALAHSAPLLLVIEDLQWASGATLNLFGLLSNRLRRLPVLLVGTVQQAEAIPGLRRLVALGRRRGELHLLALGPLASEAVADLLRAAGLDPASVETLAGWLHARSAGSPYLLSEILAQLRSEGILLPSMPLLALLSEENRWQLDTPRWLRWRTSFNLPETTHDLVAWRLAALTPQARYLLDVLAVAGQALPENVLGHFPGLQDEGYLNVVEDLLARGLLIEPPGRLLALPHHLLRETLLHRLSQLRRRTIYQRLAEALEGQVAAESGAWLRQIALYAAAGEDVERARRYGLRVLEDLAGHGQPGGAETIDFVTHLYDLLAPSASSAEMVRLTHALGTLHHSLGHLASAAHWYQQNLDWARKAGDFTAQAEACFEMSELALTSNNYQGAAQAAREGLAKIQNTGIAPPPAYLLQPLTGRGHRLLGAAYAMEGSDLAAAEYHVQAAVAVQRQLGSPVDLCAGLFELGNIAAQRGELRRALDLYDQSARAAEAGRIYYYLALARNNFAYHSLLLGQIQAAQDSAAIGIKIAEDNDLLAALLHLYSTQGEIHLYLAEWHAAEDSFRRGLTLAEDLGNLERQAGYRGGLALAARGRGELEEGARLLAEALALIEGQGYWHLRTRLQLWLAELLLEQGHTAEAGPPLDAAVAAARAQRRTLLLVQGECLRARLLAAGGDWPAADALFKETLQQAAGLGQPLETARVQAAWGTAQVRYAPTPHGGHGPAQEGGRALIAAARAVLNAHDARADLERIR